MAIRDPAPIDQSRSIITVDKSYFEEHDILHAKEKFPGCADYLTDRLGRAISGRRQYLSYREEHHQKLAKNVDLIGFEEPRTEHTSNSTQAAPIPKARTNSFDMLDGDDTLSQTSYATSVNAAIRVPPLPKEAREEEHFECPICFMIVSIHTTAGWKYASSQRYISSSVLTPDIGNTSTEIFILTAVRSSIAPLRIAFTTPDRTGLLMKWKLTESPGSASRAARRHFPWRKILKATCGRFIRTLPHRTCYPL